MTYPDNPEMMKSMDTSKTKSLLAKLKLAKPNLSLVPEQQPGIFETEGRDADAMRERLASVAMDWYRDCQSQRVRQERQWYLNLAFFYGNQNVQFRRIGANSSFDLYTPNAPQWRVRIVINQVRKIVRKEISRLCAQKPNAFVVPASTEDADVFAAQAAEQIWDSLWRDLNLNKVMREAVFWQACTGNGFLKSYWDPTKKDKDSESMGMICIQNVSPFYIFVPDFLTTDIEEQPYVIHAQVRNKSWVQQNFKTDGNIADLEAVDEGLLNVMGISRNDSKKNQVIILEVWVKPGYLPELPDGGMFTVANNQVVQGVDYWPYDHGQYPFTKLDGIVTGKFYCSSIVEDLIPIQRELNRSRSQLIESKNRMSKPQLVAEKGAVDAKKMTTEPGQLIEYQPGMQAPQPLPIQGLPSYVTEEINRLYDDLSDLSGQHEVSNGSTPPGVTAATAISFLQEQDESLIAGEYSSIEEGIEKVAAQCLNYVHAYWDEPRTVKTVGIEGTFDVQMFKNSDLKGNTDIRIEGGSALPQSRAAKQAFIMDLMKMGFIPPDEGLEIMEVGGLNRIYERIQIDKRQAQRENLKMRIITEEDIQQHEMQWQQMQQQELQQRAMQAQQADPQGLKDDLPVNFMQEMQDPNYKMNQAMQPLDKTASPGAPKTLDPENGMALDPPLLIQVNTYDNHQIHIQVHNDYRKSQNFEAASDVTKALFEEHVKQHIEAMTGMWQSDLTESPDPNGPMGSVDAETQSSDDMAQSGTQPGPQAMPDMSGDQPTQ